MSLAVVCVGRIRQSKEHTMPKEFRCTGFDEIAIGLRKMSKGAGDIVVGPVLIYDDGHDDEQWGAGVISGGNVTMVHFGGVAPEPPKFAEFVDVVIAIRKASDLKLDEAQERRAELISALKQKFRKVHVFDTELAAAKCALRLWPNARLRKLRGDLEQEPRVEG